MSLSVTTLIARYFEKFESEKVAERMMVSKNWPRVNKYCPCCSILLHPTPLCSTNERQFYYLSFIQDGYIHEDGRPYTKTEILQQWAYIGETASNRGTWMHYNIERYLNGLPPSVNIPELEQFMNFYQDVVVSRKYKPYRTEWRIVAPDLSLAGSVDLVVQKEDGSFAIIDWKRSKNLPTSMSSSFGKYGK